MKVAFKSLVAAAAFMAVGAAQAATVPVSMGGTVKNLKLVFAAENLTLSQSAVDGINAGAFTLTSVDGAILNQTFDPANPTSLTAVSVGAMVSPIFVDDTTLALQSTQSTGGFTLALVPAGLISPTGGSVSISNLKVDLATKRVYATLTGANGVGAFINYYLFDAASLAGTTTLPAASGATSFTVSGLALTADANAKFSTALGLTSIGRALLNTMASNFGSMEVQTTTTVQPITPACTVTQTVAQTGTRTFTSNVTLANNTSNTANGWTVGWDFSLPTVLSSIQNAKITSNTGMTSFKAQPVAANKTIAAGGSVTFSFRGTTRGGIPKVANTSASLGGVSCLTPAK